MDGCKIRFAHHRSVTLVSDDSPTHFSKQFQPWFQIGANGFRPSTVGPERMVWEPPQKHERDARKLLFPGPQRNMEEPLFVGTVCGGVLFFWGGPFSAFD